MSSTTLNLTPAQAASYYDALGNNYEFVGIEFRETGGFLVTYQNARVLVVVDLEAWV